MTSRQPPSVPDAPLFDMWRDYMDLAGLLLRMRSGRQTDAEDQKKPPPAAAPTRRSTCSLTGGRTGGPPDLCHFCKQNGEAADVYRSHKLKADDGKVLCPVLRRYTCPMCDATGDHAHTRRYCPLVARQRLNIPPAAKFW
ncbi:nanos homolog 2 [Entelurus aequoreus]|uniref:nanos homolog 2 n=1 Tax=Entelurus aequoreus TaxID=161455 RepID=UPI002B1D1A70|nr:nanos homolog 2 [Entelurus aequoreus]